MVAPVVPAGGGEPTDACRLWTAAAVWGAQQPALPLLKCGLSPLQQSGWGCGGSAFSPRDSVRCLQPTPHCVHSAAAGGGRRSTPGPQSASGGAGSGRWDPGLPGSGSPAPAAPPPPAPARAPFATQIAQGLTPIPQPRAAPGAQSFESGCELRHPRAPRVARGGGPRSCRGDTAFSRRRGVPCPWPAALACLWDRQFRRFSSPFPN